MASVSNAVPADAPMSVLWLDSGHRPTVERALERRGAAVHRFGITDRPEAASERTLHFAGRRGLRIDIAFIGRIRRLVRELAPDVVHVGENRRLAMHAMLALRAHPSVPVITARGAVGGLNALNPGDWLSYFSRRNQTILCFSCGMQDKLAGHPLYGRWLRGRLDYAYHAVPPPAPDTLDRAAARRELGLGDGDYAVGTVCTIRPIKNIAVAARAVEALRDDCPDMRLVVVGPPRDKAEVARIAAATGSDRIVFTGPVPNARRYMSAFDCYVSPTRDVGEGFGLAVAEAMWAGLPVISSNLGGGAELVGQGAAGLVVPPDDTDAWADALRRLHDEPALAATLGAAARDRAATLLDPDTVADRLADLYRRMAGRRERRNPA